MEQSCEQDRSGMWEDLYLELAIPDLRQAEELVAILDEARIDNFQMQAAFEEEYQRLEFEYELRLQQEGEQPQTDVKKSGRRFLKRPQGYPKETTMNLTSNTIKNRIFMSTYEQQIKRIQDEHDYRIYCDRSLLRIFMREGYELNMLCRNKLDQMRNQLCILTEKDQHTLTVFRTSHKLTLALAQAGVRVEIMMLRGVQTGYFYSTSLKLGEIQAKVNQIARLNVTLLNLNTRGLSKIENDYLFALIAESIQPTASRLQQDYEIEIEFNPRCQCIVIHKKHACFGIQVERQLKQSISQLVLLSFKSQSVRQFSNRVRKQLKELPFLKEKIKSSRNESFLSIDRKAMAGSENLNKKHLEELLKLLKIVVEPDLNVMVFVSHLGEEERENRLKRVLQLAQETHLVEEQVFSSQKYKKTFKLKDWSEPVIPKRQKNMLQFVQKLVVPQNHQKEVESFVQSFIEQESYNFDSERSKSSQSMSQLKESRSELNRGKKLKKEFNWYAFEFTMPVVKLIEQEDKAYLLGKRKKELQRLIEQKAHIKCQASALQLSNRIKWPQQVEQKAVLIRNCFKEGKINESWQFCNFDELKNQEKAFVVHLNRDLKLDFVPVLLVKRIQ